MSADIQIEETPTRLKIKAPREIVASLKEQFKYRPPDYWRSPAYQLFKQTELDPRGPRGWDGYLNLVESSKDGVNMFRGHKEELLKVCADCGYSVRGQWLTSPFTGLTVDDVPADIVTAKFELDHGQKQCVANLLTHGIGVIRVSVSGGKTVVFSSIAAMVKRRMPAARVLYLTPTERLVNQVMVETKKFLPGWDISQAGGGKKNFSGKDMVVATVAMLHSNAAELNLAGFFKSFTVLLVDEVHHAPSKSWNMIIRLVPALFRFGASDTVKDEYAKDIVKHYAIRGLFGPIRAEIDVSQLISVGRVARPHLHLIDIPEWDKEYDHLSHQAEPDSPAWCLIDGVWRRGTYKGPAYDMQNIDKRSGLPVQLDNYHRILFDDTGERDVESRWCLLQRAYDVAIVNNKKRNKLLVEWIKHFSDKGWPTLVVATRYMHVLILENMVAKAGVEVRILTGEDTTAVRDETFAWLRKGKGRVLISPLVKEGISINELRGGVIADVITDVDLARQIIGRFIRKKEGQNEAHIALFMDRQYKSARKGCLRLYTELEKVRGFSFYWPCSTPGLAAQLFTAADFD